MRLGPTLLLLAAFLALVAFAFHFQPQRETEREEALAAESRVFGGLEAEAVVAITLETSDAGAARLERVDGGWSITEPIVFPADALGADGLASALAGLESEDVFDQIEPLAAYGLDGAPSVRFQLAHPGGTEPGDTERALHIGDRLPAGGGVYVTDDEGARVWIVPAWRANALEKTLDELREHRVLEFDPGAVQSVRVSWPEASALLVRDVSDGGAWTLSQPLAAAARERTVGDLLSDLQFLRAEAFIDEPTPEQLASFETPAVEVTLTTGAGEAPIVFEVAGTAADGGRLARGPAGVIVEISDATYEDLPRRVIAFRFRELASFAPSEAARFTLSFAGDGAPVEVEAARSEGPESPERDWIFGDEALAPGAASRLLSVLSQLEAIDIAAEAMGPEELAGLGLDPPRVHIQVHGAEAGAEDEPLADVAIGTARSDGALPAQRRGSEIVYWLDAGVAREIPVGAGAFRAEFRATEEPDPDAPGPEAPDPAEGEGGEPSP